MPARIPLQLNVDVAEVIVVVTLTLVGPNAQDRLFGDTVKLRLTVVESPPFPATVMVEVPVVLKLATVALGLALIEKSCSPWFQLRTTSTL